MAGPLLIERLVADGETNLYIRLQLAGVQRRVEQPEFDSAPVENAVEVEPLIAAVVVMPMLVSCVPSVPLPPESVDVYRASPVYPVEEIRVGLFAIMLPPDVDAQGLV